MLLCGFSGDLILVVCAWYLGVWIGGGCWSAALYA